MKEKKKSGEKVESGRQKYRGETAPKRPGNPEKIIAKKSEN